MTTTHDYRGYVFTVTYEASDPAYVVEFSDIPDIMSGQSLNQAFNNACEALDVHLESLQKLGKRLPEPKHRLVVKSAR
jgi:predicted RNase H-like HicB family nuclease